MQNKLTETAPPRIWLQVSDGAFNSESEFPTDHEGITWCQDSVLESEVAYVRADIASAEAWDHSAFEWLSKRLIAADFEWGDDKETVLVITMPKGCSVSASLRDCVERGMLERMGVEDAQSMPAGDLVIAYQDQVEAWQREGEAKMSGTHRSSLFRLGGWWADRPWCERAERLSLGACDSTSA